MSKIINPVKLVGGEIIDRADCAFRLREDPEHKGHFFDLKGNHYYKNEKGVLHRYPPKIKGKKKHKKLQLNA